MTKYIYYFRDRVGASSKREEKGEKKGGQEKEGPGPTSSGSYFTPTADFDVRRRGGEKAQKRGFRISLLHSEHADKGIGKRGEKEAAQQPPFLSSTPELFEGRGRGGGRIK